MTNDGGTYANEKLSTFATEAIGAPSSVILLSGVLWSISLPYQSMASTEA